MAARNATGRVYCSSIKGSGLVIKSLGAPAPESSSQKSQFSGLEPRSQTGSSLFVLFRAELSLAMLFALAGKRYPPPPLPSHICQKAACNRMFAPLSRTWRQSGTSKAPAPLDERQCCTARSASASQILPRNNDICQQSAQIVTLAQTQHATMRARNI